MAMIVLGILVKVLIQNLSQDDFQFVKRHQVVQKLVPGVRIVFVWVILETFLFDRVSLVAVFTVVLLLVRLEVGRRGMRMSVWVPMLERGALVMVGLVMVTLSMVILVVERLVWVFVGHVESKV